jgi:hypothetical protein
MLDKKDLITVRGPHPDDINFIYASWLRGLYYGNTFYGEIPQDIFMANYQKVLQSLLMRATVRVACLKEDPEVILGYSVTRTTDAGETLDWIFVKSAWRRIGVAKSLLPNKISAVTHMSKVGKSLKPKDAVYNPFLI